MKNGIEYGGGGGYKSITQSINNFSISQAWGNLFYNSITVDVSSWGLTSKPTKIVASYTSYDMAAWTYVVSGNATTISIGFIRPTSATTNGTLYIMCFD